MALARLSRCGFKSRSDCRSAFASRCGVIAIMGEMPTGGATVEGMAPMGAVGLGSGAGIGNCDTGVPGRHALVYPTA